MHKIFFIIIMVLFPQLFMAAEYPPPPPGPPPPGLPIDGYVVLVLFVALLTGYYLSQKYILNKKDSV